MDARVEFGVLAAAFGVDATVTRPAPDDTPIATRAIWLSSTSEDAQRDGGFDRQPVGTDFVRRNPRKVLAIGKADGVSTLPRGTQILAPEYEGGEVKTWEMDTLLREDVDCWRVFVKPPALRPR